VQKTLLEILKHDYWPESQEVIPGVRREGQYSYSVDPKEEFTVLTFSDEADGLQKPDRLYVEVVGLPDNELCKSIAGLITFATKDLEPINVMSDRLERYLADKKLAHVLCHPSIELPIHGVRDVNFPVEVDRNTYMVLACEADAGILAQSPRGLRGVFIRPRSFCKIRLEFPAPTALERVLGEDLFGEDEK